MRTIKNPNHPAKDSIIRVDPIRNPEDVAAIKRLNDKKPRDLALFTLGCNTNLRGVDLLRLTVGDVRHLRAGEPLVLREKKTGKIRRIFLNTAVVEALQAWLNVTPYPSDEAPLFPNYRTGKPLTTSTLNNMVKSWCQQVGLKGNFGAHTMRKTFGYWHRVYHKTDIGTLMVLFNHSSEKQTLTYLGIDTEELRDAYRCEI